MSYDFHLQKDSVWNIINQLQLFSLVKADQNKVVLSLSAVSCLLQL